MISKRQVLEKIDRLSLKRGSVLSRISIALSEGFLDIPRKSGEISEWLSERFRKSVRSRGICAHMQKFLLEGIVKSKFVKVNNKKIRIWFGGWLSDAEALRLFRGESKEVLVIEPGTPFSAKRIVGDVLAELKGKIRICDPYVSVRTLDVLWRVPTTSPISLLTQNLSNPQRFKRELSDFKQERGQSIEVRVYSKSELHDRFVLSPTVSWQIGHSLKDLGKKQANVIKLTPDVVAALSEVFNRRWKSAKGIE
jgi:hypothetical protein